jgi:hypothetical protein
VESKATVMKQSNFPRGAEAIETSADRKDQLDENGASGASWQGCRLETATSRPKKILEIRLRLMLRYYRKKQGRRKRKGIRN